MRKSGKRERKGGGGGGGGEIYCQFRPAVAAVPTDLKRHEGRGDDTDALHHSLPSS